ncbi:hypothetical protein TcCL_Unassigned00612, partial [Trypanosoma cruzi]
TQTPLSTRHCHNREEPVGTTHGKKDTPRHAMHQRGASSPQTVRTAPTPQGLRARTHHPPHSLSSAHCCHIRHPHLTIPEGNTKQLKQQQQQNCHLVALTPLHENMRRRRESIA